MGEHEGRLCDVSDPLWAGGDVLQDAPASDQQGESAFAEAAQRAQQRVVGAGVDVEAAVVGGLLDRGVHADASSFVAGIGQGRQPAGGSGVQGTEGVFV